MLTSLTRSNRPLNTLANVLQSKLSDEKLQAIFGHHTAASASSSVQPTPKSTSSDTSPLKPVMSMDQFRTFLLSEDNSPFSEQNKGVWQDMTRPISEYYISSSHNTYLVGHQLLGVSTIEGYIRALLHSCRTVESAFILYSSKRPFN